MPRVVVAATRRKAIDNAEVRSDLLAAGYLLNERQERGIISQEVEQVRGHVLLHAHVDRRRHPTVLMNALVEFRRLDLALDELEEMRLDQLANAYAMLLVEVSVEADEIIGRAGGDRAGFGELNHVEDLSKHPATSAATALRTAGRALKSRGYESNFTGTVCAIRAACWNC